MTSISLALLSTFGCGARISDADRRQAQNRARLATSMLMEEEVASALREARRAVEIDPECVDCRLTLATIYGARAEWDRAATELERVLELAPDNPFAFNTLASVYLNTGRPAEAEPLADRASQDESYTGRHLAFYHLGWARQDQSNYRGALEAYAHALRESPRMCTAHFRIGQIYFQQRQFEDALRHLEQALTSPEEPVRTPTQQERDEPRACDEMPDVYHLLGMTLLALERVDEAGEAFARCVELAAEGSELERQCSRHVVIEDVGEPVEGAEGQE